MTIALLASGSSGNALVVSAGGVGIIVDAGLSARKLADGLHELGIPEDSISAILVTHEHSDHVCGLGPVSRRLGAPVIATRGTHGAVRSRLGSGGVGVTIAAGDVFSVGGFEVEAFALSHDGAEPVGYAISDGAVTTVIATDLGVVAEGVRERLRSADCLVLESNHDERMLMDGRYPWHLKRRIAGRRGHLSNAAAATELETMGESPLSLVVLAHLSQENNDPVLAAESALSALDAAGRSDVELHVASQWSLLGPFDVTPRVAGVAASSLERAWRR